MLPIPSSSMFVLLFHGAWPYSLALRRISPWVACISTWSQASPLCYAHMHFNHSSNHHWESAVQSSALQPLCNMHKDQLSLKPQSLQRPKLAIQMPCTVPLWYCEYAVPIPLLVHLSPATSLNYTSSWNDALVIIEASQALVVDQCSAQTICA